MVHGRPTWQEAYREWLSMSLRSNDWRMRKDVPPRDINRTRRWRGPHGFQPWAQEQLEDVYRLYWRLVRQLIEEEELTKAEAATLAPKIEVHVKDERKKPRELPKLDLKAPENPYKND